MNRSDAPEATANSDSAHPGQILIVDDERGLLDVLSRLLEDEGYHTRQAASGEQAVEAYQSYSPDAVLLDVSMPGMDGLGALRKIRSLDSDARVAMLSGVSKQAVIRNAIESGARDFILKPFDADQVLTTVADLLAA